MSSGKTWSSQIILIHQKCLIWKDSSWFLGKTMHKHWPINCHKSICPRIGSFYHRLKMKLTQLKIDTILRKDKFCTQMAFWSTWTFPSKHLGCHLLHSTWRFFHSPFGTMTRGHVPVLNPTDLTPNNAFSMAIKMPCMLGMRIQASCSTPTDVCFKNKKVLMILVGLSRRRDLKKWWSR